MFGKRFSRALVVTATASLIMATAVFADNVQNDANASGNSIITAGGSTTITYRLVATGGSCNASTASPVTTTITKAAAVAGPSSFQFVGCGNDNEVGIVFSSESAGAYPIAHAFSGGVSGHNGFNNQANFTLTVNAAAPTNSAPTVPGAPNLAGGSTTPNQGAFTLAWTASTDAQGDPITYELQHKNSASGAVFTTVASGLNINSHTFVAPSREAEGTWTYQVRASDGSLQSVYSSESSAVKVDQSAPSAPTASFTPNTADYNDGTINWWGSSVTVSYGGSTDPSLADTSAGSGVADYTDDETFSTTGTHTYSGTATDHAGNESPAVTDTIGVDVTPPVVALTCPTGPVLLNASASATWAASDVGSGLASAASGSITLDTGSVGAKTATAAAGTAVDNVDNESAQATCSYSVIFDFDGFFQPVDNMPAWNSAKAGQSVPLKFSLGGNQGLNILAGAPKLWKVSCPSAPADVIPEDAGLAATANNGLTYDSVADQYNYVWKTDKRLGGMCYQVDVTLVDGTTHSALFAFKK